MACARRRGVFRVWGLLVLLPILGGEEYMSDFIESLLRILFHLLFFFRHKVFLSLAQDRTRM